MSSSMDNPAFVRTEENAYPQAEALPSYANGGGFSATMMPHHQPPPSTGAKVKRFLRKYFLEGQKLDETQAKAIADLPPDAPLSQRILVKHRRAVGLLIPFCIVQTLYWTLAVRWNYLAVWPHRWQMGVTMIFGATVAGATSEGGGAVAYPVLSLILKTPSSVARDFSLMIQSFGMTSASFTILWMKIKLEWHSILFCNLGAIFGIIIGLEYLDPALPGEVKKLIFVSVWFSFAFALFLLNRQHKRKTYDSIPNFGVWQAVVLTGIGFVGGNFSAIAGSGVDICSFSFLTLLFRVSEKVATPTSVILMATNTVTGFFWRQLMTEGGCEREAWLYLTCAVPVVVIFAPFGAFLSSHCHRQVQGFMIYILDTLALVTALVVLPMTWQLWLMVVGIIGSGFLFFFVLCRLGQKLMELDEKREMKQRIDDVTNSSLKMP